MRKRLAPYRTKKLSSSWLMILSLTGTGKVGRCGLCCLYFVFFSFFFKSFEFLMFLKLLIKFLNYSVKNSFILVFRIFEIL